MAYLRDVTSASNKPDARTLSIHDAYISGELVLPNTKRDTTQKIYEGSKYLQLLETHTILCPFILIFDNISYQLDTIASFSYPFTILWKVLKISVCFGIYLLADSYFVRLRNRKSSQGAKSDYYDTIHRSKLHRCAPLHWLHGKRIFSWTNVDVFPSHLGSICATTRILSSVSK